jgi:uncharacterized protein YukJ
MALLYGVLKGTVTGHLRDADDDHYQILVAAGKAMYRIAVNVHSTLKPPDLRFQSLTKLPAALTKGLKALQPGFKKLPPEAGGLAQDYVRGGIVDVKKFKIVPGDRPGAANDLKDTLEDAVLKAIAETDSVVYAFGAKWGPEQKKDKYFKFTPGAGIHDIHMNQGNDKRFARDDGVYHDGCLVFQYAGGKHRVVFLAFQSQSFDTDDKTGHAKTSAVSKSKRKVRSRRRPRRRVRSGSKAKR